MSFVCFLNHIPETWPLCFLVFVNLVGIFKCFYYCWWYKLTSSKKFQLFSFFCLISRRESFVCSFCRVCTLWCGSYREKSIRGFANFCNETLGLCFLKKVEMWCVPGYWCQGVHLTEPYLISRAEDLSPVFKLCFLYPTILKAIQRYLCMYNKYFIQLSIPRLLHKI